jgi:hypothetical protein
MLVIEFLGGPGCAKTTTSVALYSKLKRKSNISGLDFAREGAQHLIHVGCAHKLNNQLTIVAEEYDRLLNMKEQGCKILITDTSLLLTKIYGRNSGFYEPLLEVIEKIREQFIFKSILIERVKPFVQYGRIHNEEESIQIDKEIKELCGPFDLIIPGDDKGIKILYKEVKKWIENLEGKENNVKKS